ncbi:MAG: hypothetical protein AAF539_00805 [Planctomycetota bacterium]
MPDKTICGCCGCRLYEVERWQNAIRGFRDLDGNEQVSELHDPGTIYIAKRSFSIPNDSIAIEAEILPSPEIPDFTTTPTLDLFLGVSLVESSDPDATNEVISGGLRGRLSGPVDIGDNTLRWDFEISTVTTAGSSLVATQLDNAARYTQKTNQSITDDQDEGWRSGVHFCIERVFTDADFMGDALQVTEDPPEYLVVAPDVNAEDRIYSLPTSSQVDVIRELDGAEQAAVGITASYIRVTRSAITEISDITLLPTRTEAVLRGGLNQSEQASAGSLRVILEADDIPTGKLVGMRFGSTPAHTTFRCNVDVLETVRVPAKRCEPCDREFGCTAKLQATDPSHDILALVQEFFTRYDAAENNPNNSYGTVNELSLNQNNYSQNPGPCFATVSWSPRGRYTVEVTSVSGSGSILVDVEGNLSRTLSGATVDSPGVSTQDNFTIALRSFGSFLWGTITLLGSGIYSYQDGNGNQI